MQEELYTAEGSSNCFKHQEVVKELVNVYTIGVIWGPPSIDRYVKVWLEKSIPQNMVTFIWRKHIGARALGLKYFELKEKVKVLTKELASASLLVLEQKIMLFS